MAYRYDVFVSYRRFKEWPKWVNDHFLPLLDHWLGEELGRDPQFFFDAAEIESGTTWPYKLATGLAESRVMVCLWSRQYFSSEWCIAELAHLRAREKACGLAGAARPGGLVLPVVIHDGDEFPPCERLTQPTDFRDVVSLRMATGSPIAEQLDSKVRGWVPDIRAAIERAPAFDPAWSGMAVEGIMDVLRRSTLPGILPNLGNV